MTRQADADELASYRLCSLAPAAIDPFGLATIVNLAAVRAILWEE